MSDNSESILPLNSPDSAIGTLQEITPDEECLKDSFNVSNSVIIDKDSTDEEIIKEKTEEEQHVIAASMEFVQDSSANSKIVVNEDCTTVMQNGVEESDERSQLKEKFDQPVAIENSDLTSNNDNQVSEVMALPSTVTKLDMPGGSSVYLIGTAHFSKESQDDVVKTIQLTKPNFIVLELCKARTAVLELDEETILNESNSLDFSKIRMIMRQHGKMQGVLYLLFLSVSAHITKQLNMAPGGEFRVAIHEARRSCPKCVIQLGDRPIHVTLGRALASLSVWQKIKLMVYILCSKGPISKEEVEKCKSKDFIEEMLTEMTDKFPGISEVFVRERDVFLTRSLQLAADPNFCCVPNSPVKPKVVVGVVGMGHVAGITKLWGKISELDVSKIMEIPPPPLSDRLVLLTVRASVFCLIGYGVYKCTPSTVKNFVQSSMHSSLSFVNSQLSNFT